MDAQSAPAGNYFARKMRHSDLDLVAHNEAVVNDYPWSKRVFVDCLRAGYQCWVLANKRRIAAHAIMSLAVGECHLLTLCVLPEFQRQGYGRRLFRLLLERAYQLEAQQCFLEVRVSNSPAIGLYRAMGFTEVSRRRNYYPARGGREDALIMSRSLPLP